MPCKIDTVYAPPHKMLFPILRRLSDGAFHSGQDLARDFHLSRTSIFNILNQAETLGLTVHAVRGRGYRVPAAIEWLDSDTVAAHLGDLGARGGIRVLDTVDSTNAALMSAALAGARDGTVFCAEYQSAGKGRRGRPWHGVLGGSLTFSILWRFERGLQSMAGLSLAVGLAIARAINRHSRYPARLKWPNDVLVDHRKLAGILVEVQGDMHGAALAVVGVGLNVSLNAAQRHAIDQAVIDLDEMGVTVGRNQLLADCLRELHSVLSLFRDGGFAALRAEWMALDAYAGKQVMLSLPGAPAARGTASGVDDTGALLLRDARQTLHTYSGGEISLRLDGVR